MDKKTEFKEFVKGHPKLISFVKNGEMTWQRFYEMYDLYGGEGEVWNPYLSKENTRQAVGAAATGAAAATAGVGLADMFGWLKQIDLDGVQGGINSLQRVLSVISDLKTPETKKPEYKPRPLYKHFED